MISPTPQDPTPLILSTWNTPSLLPSSLPLSPAPSRALLAALHDLATLTPAQPERAWNLISTYFLARIREASYTGRGQGGLYAAIEADDVRKAVGSVRRMSVGRGMEGGVRREEGSKEKEKEGGIAGKRKWSIRDEVVVPNLDEAVSVSVKKPRLDTKEAQHMGEELPPLPAILDMEPRPESRIELPPIYTLTEREEHMVSLETLVEAARGAMLERNLCRRELDEAEERVWVARRKYAEARRLAERLRGEVRRVEGTR